MQAILPCKTAVLARGFGPLLAALADPVPGLPLPANTHRAAGLLRRTLSWYRIAPPPPTGARSP